MDLGYASLVHPSDVMNGLSYGGVPKKGIAVRQLLQN